MSWYSHIGYYWRTKTFFSRNWFYFFFPIFWHAKIQPYFRMSCYRLQFFANFFSSALYFSNLLSQNKSLTIFFMYTHDDQVQNFLNINCFTFANFMNNTTIINILTVIIAMSLNIITTITNIMLKFKLMIKKPVMTSHTFLAAATFSRINSFAYINSFIIRHL